MWIDTGDPGLRSNYRSNWDHHEHKLNQVFKKLGVDTQERNDSENGDEIILTMRQKNVGAEK